MAHLPPRADFDFSVDMNASVRFGQIFGAQVYVITNQVEHHCVTVTGGSSHG